MRDFDYRDAIEFLGKLYEHTEHAVEIRSLSNDGSEPARPRFTRDPGIAAEHCQRWDVPGRGVYMAMATRITGRATGKREDLAELIVLWVDIDCYKLGITKEEAIAALRLCPFTVSIIVDSGGGIHGYWLLREPLDARLHPAANDDIKERVDAVLKQLAGVFAGDPIVCQISAVMRLPGTHNTKDGTWRDVRVLEASWARHELGDIEEALFQLRPLLRAPGAAERPAEPPNAYTDFAKRFSFKTPLDVEARLADMTYLSGSTGIHWTQLQVSASLIRQGVDDDSIVELLLNETRRVAFPYGEKWNWKREERNLRRMIDDWRKKIEKEPKPAPAPARSQVTVVQLRGGGANPAADASAAEDVEVVDVPKLAGYPLNDLGNAMRLIIQHGTSLRYVVGIGWHVWDGRRYEFDPATVAGRRLAHETVRTMLTQAFDQTARTKEQADSRKTLIKFAISSGNTNKIAGMLSQAEPHLAVVADDLDKDPMLLNCLNGTFDLRTGHINRHSQNDLLTKLCGTHFDETAECPKWEKFLLEIFGDDEKLVAFVQRAIGYSLTGITSEQVVFILHGSGSNGKSVLIETVAAVLADYVKRSPAETWISKPNSGPSNDIAALPGARLVSVVETEHDKQLAEALVKQATGGDAMTARFHYKEFFSFIPKFKLWFATNHKPRIRGSDYAIWRRILLLPFNITFVEAPKDGKIPEGQKTKNPELKNELAAEFPGILAWMIRGCLAWQETGLQPPDAVVHATESYQDSQDNVSGFIRDNCHLSRGIDCGVGILHAGYEIWCEENDEEPISKRAFGKNLDDRGYPPGPRTTHDRLRKGIDLKEDFKMAAAHRVAMATDQKKSDE